MRLEALQGPAGCRPGSPESSVSTCRVTRLGEGRQLAWNCCLEEIGSIWLAPPPPAASRAVLTAGPCRVSSETRAEQAGEYLHSEKETTYSKTLSAAPTELSPAAAAAAVAGALQHRGGCRGAGNHLIRSDNGVHPGIVRLHRHLWHQLCAVGQRHQQRRRPAVRRRALARRRCAKRCRSHAVSRARAVAAGAGAAVRPPLQRNAPTRPPARPLHPPMNLS